MATISRLQQATIGLQNSQITRLIEVCAGQAQRIKQLEDQMIDVQTKLHILDAIEDGILAVNERQDADIAALQDAINP